MFLYAGVYCTTQPCRSLGLSWLRWENHKKVLQNGSISNIGIVAPRQISQKRREKLRVISLLQHNPETDLVQQKVQWKRLLRSKSLRKVLSSRTCVRVKMEVSWSYQAAEEPLHCPIKTLLYVTIGAVTHTTVISFIQVIHLNQNIRQNKYMELNFNSYSTHSTQCYFGHHIQFSNKSTWITI